MNHNLILSMDSIYCAQINIFVLFCDSSIILPLYHASISIVFCVLVRINQFVNLSPSLSIVVHRRPSEVRRRGGGTPLSGAKIGKPGAKMCKHVYIREHRMVRGGDHGVVGALIN